jgi:hypothetical protein
MLDCLDWLVGFRLEREFNKECYSTIWFIGLGVGSWNISFFKKICTAREAPAAVDIIIKKKEKEKVICTKRKKENLSVQRKRKLEHKL